MTVTAPPRPPRQSDPVDREEIEALVQALIEEARQRARRRRRLYGTVAVVIALVGVAIFTLFERTAQSQTASPAHAVQTGGPAVAGSTRIAFTRNTGPMSGDAKELYVINADGSGQQRLAHISSFGIPPAWSPDGRRLAFVRGRGPNAEIYVVNSDGNGQRRLTRTSGWGVPPHLVAGRAEDRLPSATKGCTSSKPTAAGNGSWQTRRTPLPTGHPTGGRSSSSAIAMAPRGAPGNPVVTRRST